MTTTNSTFSLDIQASNLLESLAKKLHLSKSKLISGLIFLIQNRLLDMIKEYGAKMDLEVIYLELNRWLALKKQKKLMTGKLETIRADEVDIDE